MIADLDHVNDFWIFIEEGDKFTFDDEKPLKGRVLIQTEGEFKSANLYIYGDNSSKKISISSNNSKESDLMEYSIYLPRDIILEISQKGSFARRNHSSPNLTNFGIFICRIHKNSQHYQRYRDLQMVLNSISN